MQFSYTTFAVVPPDNNPFNTEYTILSVIPGDVLTITLSGAFFDTNDGFPDLGALVRLTAPIDGFLAGAVVTYVAFDVWAQQPGPYTATISLPTDSQTIHIFGVSQNTDYETYDDQVVMVPQATQMALSFSVMNSAAWQDPFPWIAKVTVTVDNVLRNTTPDFPENFTPEEKAKLQEAANSINTLVKGLGVLSSGLDPNPAVKLAGTLAGQLGGLIDSRVGSVNSAVQLTLTAAKTTMNAVNPVTLPILIASLIDQGTARILQILADDPPDGNFTEVYDAPDWDLGLIPGATPLGNTFVLASWALFQDASNMLAAVERHQGAALAGDQTLKNLQAAAFDDALAAFNLHKLQLADVLDDFLAEIQGTISDADLSTDAAALAALQDYLTNLADPLVDDAFIAAFIDSLETDRPYLDSTTEGDVTSAIAAILGLSSSGGSGSAFAAIAAAADELAGIDTTSVTPVLAGITTDSGPNTTDEITNDSTPTINGTAEAGATVEVFRGATSLGTTTADGSGQWSFTDPTTLADGSYSYTAIATDLANNVSATSAPLPVTVDTTNPALPTDSNAAANSVAENAANGTTVGVTAASTDTNGITYSLTDNAGGRFAIDPVTGVVTVANGSLLDFETATSHTVTARATDAAGNVADQSFVIAVSDVLEINQVLGTTGNDKDILGTAGADRIDGLAGKDKMTGFGGDDTYVVDNKSDKVVEALGGGIDTVESSVTAKLAAYVENLILTGNAAINATGNDLDNVITGNAGNNILDGGKRGNDIFVFSGVFGNDTIKGFVGNGAALGDTIQFDHSIFADADAVIAATTDTGKNLFIDAGAFGTITLFKVADISLLHPSDFTFV